MNNKAQTPIGIIFSLGLFILVWALWGAETISDWGQQAVTQYSLTGLEAFLYMNLNYVIFVVLLVSMFGYVYWAKNE